MFSCKPLPQLPYSTPTVSCPFLPDRVNYALLCNSTTVNDSKRPTAYTSFLSMSDKDLRHKNTLFTVLHIRGSIGPVRRRIYSGRKKVEASCKVSRFHKRRLALTDDLLHLHYRNVFSSFVYIVMQFYRRKILTCIYMPFMLISEIY